MPRNSKSISPPLHPDYYDAPSSHDSPPSAAPSDITLEREIQLLRWLIRWLKRDTTGNNLAISRLISLIFRAVAIELDRDTSADDLRAELEEAGERVLRMLEAEDAAPSGFLTRQAHDHLTAHIPVGVRD